MACRRRAGDKPIESEESEERRIDIINRHEVRIAILEAAHKDTVDSREAHSRAIDELNKNLHDTASALREGLAAFTLKFDSLISQIKTGFFIITTGCAAVIFLAGVFFTYSKELDEKYLHNSKVMQENMQEQLQQQVAEKESDIDDINNELTKLKKLKVIRGSK
jgi:hypothetical protein